MSIIIEGKEFWEHQLEKFKASSLTRSQFCRENGINYDRFGYWIKRLSHTPSEFVPVKLQSPTRTTSYPILCTIEFHSHIVKIHELSALSFFLERLA